MRNQSKAEKVHDVRSEKPSRRSLTVVEFYVQMSKYIVDIFSVTQRPCCDL